MLELDIEHKKQEQALLDSLKQQRYQLLKKLEGELSSNERQLTQLIESETKLKNLIAELQEGNSKAQKKDTGFGWMSWFSGFDNDSRNAEQNPPADSDQEINETKPAAVDFAELKGKLPWPVKGKLISRAGSGQFEARSPKRGRCAATLENGMNRTPPACLPKRASSSSRSATPAQSPSWILSSN